MNQTIQDFVDCKRLAVVGVSHNPQKFGSAIFTELKSRGYQVYGVNPNLKDIGGDPCYPDLLSLKGQVDGVVICVKSAQASEVLRAAAEIGLDKIWLQQGSDSPEVMKTAGELGQHPVTRKCILMYATPVQSFHKVHRFVAKVFGQL
jgi:predicted CoA-binding protein